MDSNTTYGCVTATLESPADTTGISNYRVQAILPVNGTVPPPSTSDNAVPPPSTSDNASDLEVEICGLNLCDESYMYRADANGGNICPSIISATLSLSSEWFTDFKVFCTVNQLESEIKELVRKKKLDSWNEVIEKANKDFDVNKKEFWAFVGRTSKGSRKSIASLRSSSGSCVTSTKGKLEVLHEHYGKLGTASVDDQFDDSWREHVENKVTEYSEMSSARKDKVLDRDISYAEIKKCLKSLKNNKTGGNDGLVGELFKYGGSGMVNLLKALYEVVWTEEGIPKQWRQGLIVSLYKKGDAEDPGNYRGITLLNVVGKLFCKILNNRLVIRLESEKALHEGQAGFRAKRSCVDNVFTLNEIIQGRIREGKHTYAFFLDVQKAFDTVWHDGLWFRLWELGVRGRMWRVIKKMYDITESAVLLEGEKSKPFDISQGVAQGCSLSPILFSIFINQLLDEVEKAGLGIIIKNDVKVGGLMFADDFVGLTTNAEDLQKLINVVQGFCNKWRLKSNIKKSAVVVFSKVAITDMCAWKWGDKVIPRVVSYCYLGIEFAENGSWDSHVQKVIDNGKKKLNRLHRFVSNRNISTVARRLLLVSVLRPTLEYGSEVWACNKRQTASLESIQLGAAKKILGCSSKTCNEAVRGDMGLESLKGRRDRSKLKWWYKVNKLDNERYPRVLLDAEWEVKPCRGRQRKTWMKVINELLLQLDLDSQEVLAADNINLFLDTVDEALRDREYKDFNDSLNTKVKLNLYKSFCKEIEFKNYLQGVGDPGTRLLFKFRSGTNGLNEELGRHRGKNDDRQCKLCRGECESVVHVLWECPAYDSIRNNFMVELENLLGGRFGEFSTLDNFNKASFILGFENWNRDDFKALLKLVKSFVLLIWEARKKELYGDQDCVVSGCSCSCPLTGGLTSSACVCGCVVNGVSATAAT